MFKAALRLACLCAFGLSATATAAESMTGVSPVANPSTGSVSGIYGAIRMHPETEDLLGLQVLVFDDPKAPHVKVLLCEGECHCWESAPLRRDGERFSFDVVEMLREYPSGKSVPNRMHYEGRFVGNGLKLTGTDSDMLRRQKQRWDHAQPLPDCKALT